MNKPSLSVIIPSRKQERQMLFLRRSVSSIRNQTIAKAYDMNIIVATDKNDALDPDICAELGVNCMESKGFSQASALNAAVSSINCQYVAFLEDDDRWQPNYLEIINHVKSECDFISSNQVEIDDDGNFIRFLDFPTPSGWFMPTTTIQKVGLFDEKFRFHIDNEWLGRLNQTGLRRIHLVDSSMPDDYQTIHEKRCDIFLILKFTNNRCRVLRHNYPFPLVQRYVHSESGMARIANNFELNSVSHQEYGDIIKMYGHIPT